MMMIIIPLVSSEFVRLEFRASRMRAVVTRLTSSLHTDIDGAASSTAEAVIIAANGGTTRW